MSGDVTIVPCPVDDSGLLELLAIHKAFAIANTPEDSGHALSPDEALPETLHYLVAKRAGEAVGCVGLMEIEPNHGEIKSMHVREAARGLGLGQQLLDAALRMAEARGFARVSLETGRGEGFAASRRLYERRGFEVCAPFGAYRHDPFSVCMTRDVSRET